MNSWLDNEFAEQNMGDARLNKRMKQLVESLSQDPLESIPNATHYWEETIAAYRFFDNPKSSFDSIMSGHQAASLKRIQKERVVLIPQDTTFLNFATDDKSKKMGTLRSKNANQQLLHTSIAISTSRVNLGIIDGSMWQREEKSTGRSRNTKKITEKESSRWIDHYQKACDIQAQSPDTELSKDTHRIREI